MEDNNNTTVNLPPGFRFCPTDEELVLHFLYRKSFCLPCYPNIIPDLDLHLHDPWNFTGLALSCGDVYYFFSKVMENKVTSNGFWKEMDIKEPMFNGSGNKVGAVKKYFVFYVGESPAGFETNWVMEEYSLCSINKGTHKRRRKQKLEFEWVLCRVHERKADSRENFGYEDDDNGTELSCLDEMFLSLDDDDLEESSLQI
ncbi:hypothetical protein UlMin_037696 [Ulmus minor]